MPWFSLLPPPGRAPSLYSSFVGKWSSTSAPSAQKNALGKVLWHQFTTVVILRENMHQRGLTRIATDCPAGPSLSDPWFRQISIITACNAHRDAINARRTREFAADRGVLLHSFFSYDRWGKAVNSDSARQAQRLYEKTIDPEMLWQVPPCMSDHHAGILTLCIGMPVLLKFNEATELCATNGAEAEVVKMVAGKTPCGRPCLESLHVRLTSLPQNVQVPGLPMNVIPLGRSKRTVSVTLPASDTVVAIAREQVMILPNFAMTDYACQGRTRPDNVVHLKFCKNHQAISSLSGTLILGDFDAAKIQSGCSSALHQEFRELELLDNMMCLCFSGQLPDTVSGYTHGLLLGSYLEVRGKNWVSFKRRFTIAVRQKEVWDHFDGSATRPSPAVADAPTADEEKELKAWTKAENTVIR
ncbi:hypothetical protein BC628DRAFT_1406785 [Trametes gibbosa]|nr:hypothetical protein BC628DRAFT_1406785 [Trametes gibbosa]